MPGSPPDLFKGFREELGKIETKRAQEQAKAEAKEKEDQQRVVQMAAKIEQADKSTMFGSDYSIASQWAQHLTDNLDTYASTTEGLVKFQQQAAQLNSFIDASEAYKKENFGSSKDNPQAGTAQGFFQRDALGKNVYGDLIDKRDKQSYEMAFMGLQQPIQVQWGEEDTMMIVKDGKAVSFAEYMRPENPFMPQLEEGKITLGSTWYAEKAPNKVHETKEQAYNWTLDTVKTDPALQRQAARDYQRKQLEEGKNLSVDEILASPDHLNQAQIAWATDAVTSWVNPKKRTTTGGTGRGPTQAEKRQAQQVQSLLGSVVTTSEAVASVPSFGSVEQQTEEKLSTSFTPDLSREIDITDFIPSTMFEVEGAFGEPSSTVYQNVTATPSNISVDEDGMITLSGLGNFNDQRIEDITIDPQSDEGRRLVGSLNGAFIDDYGFSFNDFIRQLSFGMETPETATGSDPLGLFR